MPISSLTCPPSIAYAERYSKEQKTRKLEKQ